MSAKSTRTVFPAWIRFAASCPVWAVWGLGWCLTKIGAVIEIVGLVLVEIATAVLDAIFPVRAD